MFLREYWLDQREEIAPIAPDPAALLRAGLPVLRPRVPRPPGIPSHSSIALEAKAHALVEMAASFSPPAVVAWGGPPQVGLLPHFLGTRPF